MTSNPIEVLLICDRLDTAGGVERMTCQLASHWSALGHRVAVASVATPAAQVHYPLPPGVRVLQALARDPAAASTRTIAPTALAATSAPTAMDSRALDAAAPSSAGSTVAAAAALATARRWLRRLGLARREWQAGRALARLLRAERPQVVVLNGLTTACSVLAFAPHWAPRAICCDHNHFEARSRPWRRARGWLYRRAGAVVSLTDADGPRFRTVNPRTVVIPNASALQADGPSPGEPGRVLAVGRCVAQKGLDLLLQAWIRVASACPEARLHIVGDGPLLAEWQSLAEQLGVARSVVWHGRSADMPAHYRAASLFVLPSRYEGMPLALLEAQALGVPSVAFDCPTGPREVIGAVAAPAASRAASAALAGVDVGPGGLVVPAEDVEALAAAIVAVLRDPAWRDRLARGAWRRSREAFDPQRMLGRWTGLLEQVAAGEGASRDGRVPMAGGVGSVTPDAPTAPGVPGAQAAQAPQTEQGPPAEAPPPRIVSVIVPCRNESGYLDAFLASLWRQRLPAGWQLQVVIADGASDDGTRARLGELAAAEPRLRVIDNPARITSAALNRALAVADGDSVVRMDVHTVYADDYVAECLRALDETGASCVGGPWRPVGEGWPQAAIAAAFRSGFGSGGAASRRTGWSGPVDTVYLGAWRRDELRRFGGFDEALVRNQDDELNLRIVRQGGRVWQSAAIRSEYAPRASFAALFRQFYQYGYWKVPVIRKHRLPAAPRHLVPFAFVATLIGLAVLAPWWRPAGWALVTVLALYGGAALSQAAPLATSPHRLREALGIAWAFFCMHAGYGLGFGRALLDLALRRGPAEGAVRLTR